jgi:hypothetical protein
MAEQTAVEWFMSQIIDGEIDPSTNAIFLKRHINKVEVLEKAKQMQEQQIVDAYKHGQNNGLHYRFTGMSITGEEYYEQTYKTQAQ